MSRTYRKNSITTEESKVAYVNRNMEFFYRHYSWKSYFPAGRKEAYEKAFAEYKSEISRYYRLRFTCFAIEYPEQPREWDYRVVERKKVEYDYEKERKKLEREYDSFKRDGKLNETGRNTAFKKHCTGELRVHNRRLARKILKDDIDWDQKPYPDTYLGKLRIWDYW